MHHDAEVPSTPYVVPTAAKTAANTNATPPSTLLLLHELGVQKPGAKVKFAGIVTSYDASSGRLMLTSSFPVAAYVRGEDEAGELTRGASVDAALVTAVAAREVFEEGTEVVVVGYVEEGGGGRATDVVAVQALLILTAEGDGSLYAGKGNSSSEEGRSVESRYEDALLARRSAMEAMRVSRKKYADHEAC